LVALGCTAQPSSAGRGTEDASIPPPPALNADDADRNRKQIVKANQLILEQKDPGHRKDLRKNIFPWPGIGRFGAYDVKPNQWLILCGVSDLEHRHELGDVDQADHWRKSSGRAGGLRGNDLLGSGLIDHKRYKPQTPMHRRGRIKKHLDYSLPDCTSATMVFAAINTLLARVRRACLLEYVAFEDQLMDSHR
jgi:hypothetical protein